MIERVNADFSQKANVKLDSVEWQPSPIKGVERKYLDRIGDEVARATSVVRFLAGNSFSPHTHGGGEEFLVLSGVFSDESGDYGPLSYVRNPPGSHHAPRSDEGCQIFVKLCQMRAQDEPSVTIDASTLAWEPSSNEGHWSKILFKAEKWYEEVALEKLVAGTALDEETFSEGAEIMVLSGLLNDGYENHEALSWIRYPKGANVTLKASEPVEYWIKRGINPPT